MVVCTWDNKDCRDLGSGMQCNCSTPQLIYYLHLCSQTSEKSQTKKNSESAGVLLLNGKFSLRFFAVNYRFVWDIKSQIQFHITRRDLVEQPLRLFRTKISASLASILNVYSYKPRDSFFSSSLLVFGFGIYTFIASGFLPVADP